MSQTPQKAIRRRGMRMIFLEKFVMIPVCIIFSISFAEAFHPHCSVRLRKFELPEQQQIKQNSKLQHTLFSWKERRTSRTGALAIKNQDVLTSAASAIKSAFYDVPPMPLHDSKLEVMEGRVPEWLVGTYYRNGPGMFSAGDQKFDHLFDGYGLLCKFEFKPDHSVVWRSRFVQSEAYQAAKQGEMKFNEFGTAAGVDSFSKGKALLRTVFGGLTDNASVNIVRIGDTMLALTESSRGTYEFDPQTLATKQQFKWEDGLNIQLNTAHPMPDGQGGFYNLATIIGLGSSYTIVHTPANSRRRTVVASIPAPLFPCWLHAFGTSEKHIIVIESPAPFNIGGLLGLGELTKPAHFSVDWDPTRPTRIFVISRATGAVVSRHEVPPFFYFHIANSYDSADGQSIIVDLCAYDDPTIVSDLALTHLRTPPPPPGTPAAAAGRQVSESRLTRLTIPLAAGRVPGVCTVDDPAVTGRMQDFPAVNPGRAGREHRFVWGVGAARPCRQANTITKVDIAGGAGSARWHEPGAVVGEPVMIPRPAGAGGAGGAEDDGVVISLVCQADGQGVLVILDAATLQVVCRLRVPVPLPYGFHGIFVPAGGASSAAGGRN